MERDEFIGKLNLCYFGEKNARDEIISVYDNIILDNKKYKEVIDNVIKRLEEGITFCKNDSQGFFDKCNIAIQREQKILDILKEVE